MKRKDNKIENCFIQLKNEDIIFMELKSGEVLVNLDGYAIVPKEQYLELISDSIEDGI